MSIKATETEEGILLHFHLSDNTPSEEAMLDNKPVIWKDVLVEGEYPMSPGPGGAVAEPMKVVPSGSSDYKTRTISMSELINSHDDGAFKYVTIPTRHEDQVLDNTGFIPRPGGLRKLEKNGRQVLQAALGFTEPDVKGKVERGTIPDVSGGILFNFLNKHKKKHYGSAMKHVALTGVPFMGNLDPFKAVFASDEEVDIDPDKIEFYEFADDGTEDSGSDQIVWKEEGSFRWIQREIQESLNPERNAGGDGEIAPSNKPSYYVQDVNSDVALCEEFYKGNTTRFVIPYSVDDAGSVAVAPATRWVEVEEAMIAASDDEAPVIRLEDVSIEAVITRLSDCLENELGTKAKGYKIDLLTLDNRVKIVSTEDNATWVARFSMLGNGEVLLTPSSKWERIASPPEEDSQQPKSSQSKVVELHDPATPEGRLAAARQRRRQMVSSR